jgi:hypothetical protein
VPVPDAIVTSDRAEVRSGLDALSRVATTPLWSADFELPAAPPPPVTRKPWDYASTPDISLPYAGGAASAPLEPVTGGAGAPWRWPAYAEVEPEEPDLNLLELMTLPMRLITGGIVEGAKAVGGAWQGIGQAVGGGVNAVAGAVGHGVQQAAGAVGDFAANAWKSITSIRLW